MATATTAPQKNDPGSDYVIPSVPMTGLAGETSIAGQKIGLHWTTRGVIGSAYVALGVGLAVVGLVFIVGGVKETQQLISSVAKGRII